MFDLRNPTVLPAAGRLRLALAGILSLLFHVLALGAGHWLAERRPSHAAETPALLQATLMQPPPEPAPALIAPDSPEPAAPPTTAAPKPPPPPRPPRATAAKATMAGEVARAASQQIAEHLFYPPEAIAHGLEGEAQVMLFLDAAGNAVAARLERSSGHAILDDAAVHAARAVRSLPDAAPREVLLPVRFRLR